MTRSAKLRLVFTNEKNFRSFVLTHCDWIFIVGRGLKLDYFSFIWYLSSIPALIHCFKAY